MGLGTQIVGGAVTAFLGIVVIAAIYQLGKKTNPVVPAVTKSFNNTLTSLFKK